MNTVFLKIRLKRIMSSDLRDMSREVEKSFVKTLQLFEKLLRVTNFRVVKSSLLKEKFQIFKIYMLF